MQTECVFLMSTVDSFDDNVGECGIDLLLQETLYVEEHVQICLSSPTEEEVLGDKVAAGFKTVGPQSKTWVQFGQMSAKEKLSTRQLWAAEARI
jgi:hypothetical protein